MILVSGFEELASRYISQWREPVIGLGTFDGVHVGHQALLSDVVAKARSRGGTSAALVFDKHPMEVLDPASVPPLLTTNSEKAALIEALGVDYLVMARFDREFAAMPPETFASKILVGQLRAAQVVAGFNYTFGARGSGDADFLIALGKKLGFRTTILPPVYVADQPVASSNIRKLLQTGEVRQAAVALGRPYRVTGKTIAGEGRGKTLGFPTANLACPPEKLIPADGVYAAWVEFQGITRPALAVSSDKPTFGRSQRAFEVLVLDFQGNLYGKELTVSFLEKLRDIVAFPSAEALGAQIEADVAATRQITGNKGQMHIYNTGSLC
ncbi:MAG: bifunctional riboflavin kinase/FAD synthetase [Syntrophothermus sp.]